jgi:hypothetical protein
MQYDKRRPTLMASLAAADRGEIEVCPPLDRGAAAAAFRQWFPADLNDRVDLALIRDRICMTRC